MDTYTASAALLRAALDASIAEEYAAEGERAALRERYALVADAAGRA